MFTLKAQIYAAIVAAALLAAWGYGQWCKVTTERAVTARYELALAKQKAKAAQVLAEETDKVLRLERDLSRAADKIKESHDARKKTAADYERRLAAAAAGGLRDPHATGCRAGGDGAQGAAPAAAPGGAAGGAETSGVLSGPLTGLLQRIVREAQEVNDAYAACRVDAQALRLQLSPP